LSAPATTAADGTARGGGVGAAGADAADAARPVAFRDPPWLPLLARARKITTGLFPVALLLYLWLGHAPASPWACLLGGLVLIGAGAGLRVWAAGYLLKQECLTTAGPFARVRNPLYLGSLLAGAGFCLASGVWWSWAALGLLAIPIYGLQIGVEERSLSARFGSAFAQYYRSVPRLLPRLRAIRAHAPSGEFRWSRVLANREHQWSGAIILMAAALWLIRAF
jgi:protein-S-isoprenylcysteine O-methyltransferase Ste14